MPAGGASGASGDVLDRAVQLGKVFEAFDLDQSGAVEAGELMALGQLRKELGQKETEVSLSEGADAVSVAELRAEARQVLTKADADASAQLRELVKPANRLTIDPEALPDVHDRRTDADDTPSPLRSPLSSPRSSTPRGVEVTMAFLGDISCDRDSLPLVVAGTNPHQATPSRAGCWGHVTECSG